MRKTTKLKKMLQSSHTEFLLEAHNGISSRIVEEAGFSGIWASGLSISASLGVRDSNEASWTQVLEVVEFMSDATSIPILLDADTGFGNFNNVRRLVKKLEQRGVAGMCIEDKEFPKSNSLLDGVKQPLAKAEEFSGKIKAAKDTQLDPDFCVVARIEAFIAGYGLDEALSRATAYRQAGADGILIHSKKSNPDEVLTFMREWDIDCPIVLVPTTYYKTPTSILSKEGADLIIWANHILRASVHAMQKTASKVFLDKSIDNIEQNISPLEEIFRLQDVDELRAAESQYFPTPLS